MTNGEKYKSVNERIESYDQFCNGHSCDTPTACICRDTRIAKKKPSPCTTGWRKPFWTRRRKERGMNIVIETKKAEAIALCNSIISDVTKGYECLGTVGALIVALSAIDRIRAVNDSKKEGEVK